MREAVAPLAAILVAVFVIVTFGTPPALAAVDPNGPMIVAPDDKQVITTTTVAPAATSVPVAPVPWRSEIGTPNCADTPNVSYDPYIAAWQQTGVPWQLLAAAHWREANMAPNRSAVSGEKLGAINPDTGKVEGNRLEETVVRSAQIMRSNAERVYGITGLADENTWPDALLAYNRGAMYANAAKHGHTLTWRDSAYVTKADRWAGVGHYGRGEDWGEPESVQGKRDSRLGALEMIVCIEAHHALVSG